MSYLISTAFVCAKRDYTMLLKRSKINSKFRILRKEFKTSFYSTNKYSQNNSKHENVFIDSRDRLYKRKKNPILQAKAIIDNNIYEFNENVLKFQRSK